MIKRSQTESWGARRRGEGADMTTPLEREKEESYGSCELEPPCSCGTTGLRFNAASPVMSHFGHGSVALSAGLGGMQPIHINVYSGNDKRLRKSIPEQPRSEKGKRKSKKKMNKMRKKSSKRKAKRGYQSPGSECSSDSFLSESSSSRMSSSKSSSSSSDSSSDYKSRRDKRSAKSKRKNSKKKGKSRKGCKENDSSDSGCNQKDSVSEEYDTATEDKARVIQSHVRGFLTRKELHSVAFEDSCRAMVEEMIDDNITGDFIPDILIDVLTNRSNEYDAVSFDQQICYEVLENIMKTVVDKEVRDSVRYAVRDFMDSFLQHQINKKDADPVYMCAMVLIDETLKDLFGEIVRESLLEMVDEFLFLQRFEAFLDSLLEIQIKEAVRDSLYEEEVETSANEIFDLVFSTMVSSTTRECVEESEQLIHNKKQAADYENLSSLMGKLLDRSILQVLIQTVATKGENVSFREQMDIFLNRQIASSLFVKIRENATTQRELAANAPMRHAFQAATTKALFKSILPHFLESLTHFENDTHLQEVEESQRAVGKGNSL